MPKLLIFVPCEMILIAQDQTISLIQVMNKITLSGEIPDPLPLNAAVQTRWSILAQWETSPEEVGQKFNQRVRIAQGENIGLEAMSEFTPEAGKPVHRTVANLSFFPLVAQGKYRLTLEICRDGQEQWQQMGDYPFEVAYEQIAVNA